MTRTPIHRSRVARALPVAVLATLALAVGPAPATAAPAAGFETLTPLCSPTPPVQHPGCRTGYRGAPLPSGTSDEVVRLAGADRFATAVAVAEHGFPEADVVVLVSGADRHLVDALSAGPLARSLAAPVLLATRDEVPAATAAYLREHAVRSVLLVGGEDALSASTPDRLRALGIGDVQRIAGADRYATSRAVAASMPTATHAWAASGEDAHLVDALAAAGPAARLGEALVLVDDADPVLAGETLRARGATSTTVVGGPEGVLPEALATLPTPHRAAGPDRFGTAAAVAVESLQRGLPAQDLLLAPGLSGHLVDALAAGPLGRTTLLVGDDQSARDVVEAWFETYGAGRTTAVGAVEITS